MISNTFRFLVFTFFMTFVHSHDLFDTKHLVKRTISNYETVPMGVMPNSLFKFLEPCFLMILFIMWLLETHRAKREFCPMIEGINIFPFQ